MMLHCYDDAWGPAVSRGLVKPLATCVDRSGSAPGQLRRMRYGMGFSGDAGGEGSLTKLSKRHTTPCHAAALLHCCTTAHSPCLQMQINRKEPWIDMIRKYDVRLRAYGCTYTHTCMHACHATPRHATPRHATPRHATPRHATPRHACIPAYLDTLIHAYMHTCVHTCIHTCSCSIYLYHL
jgi:hypothetical protein